MQHKKYKDVFSGERPIHSVLTGFGLVTALLLSVILFLGYTGDRMASRHAPLVEAAMQIQLNATQGHLWFEEILSGDRNEDIETVWHYFDKADWYAAAMLEGGRNLEGVYLPLNDARLRRSIQVVRETLSEFIGIARQRYKAYATSQPGSDIDQRFDGVFHRFVDRTNEVAGELQTLIATDLDNFRKMAVVLIGLSALVSATVAFVLFRLEHQRHLHLSAIDRAQAKLDYLAHFDKLTELPNRTLFLDRLEQAIARANKNGGHIVLLFVDLDKFKSVNDRLGHDAGDRVLGHAARRLMKTVRAEDSVARLGGDEFTVILSDIDDNAQAMGAAHSVSQSILQELAQPFSLDDQTAHVSASIGIAIYPQDGESADELLISADQAMFESKRQRKGDFRFHSQEINQRVQRQLRIETELRDAIRHNQLIIHYQPQWDLKSGKLSGMEALVRWLHPKDGLLPPCDFIPIAEGSGQIEKLDIWVMENACRQYARWREEGFNPGKLAVNLSASLFHRPDLIRVVSACTAEHCLREGQLELELTESALLENSKRTRTLLEQLAAQGVHLAIDDFGTGYSSMAYLRHFPAKTLKIDRSFTSDIHAGKTANAILRGMVDLAKNLDMKVVAEGIETPAQQDFVRALGCDFGQGFHLGRPVPAETMRALMLSQGSDNVEVLPPNGNT